MYRVKEVSELTGISVRMLHNYINGFFSLLWLI